jgi:hypothetical protein
MQEEEQLISQCLEEISQSLKKKGKGEKKNKNPENLEVNLKITEKGGLTT